ncbi:MAG: hypothetical protein ACTSSH_04425 [Candidatus Heimdallarchaeota archaeon]
MADNEHNNLELSPSFKERLGKSILALVGFTIGVISIIGVLIVEIKSDMVTFAAIFLGALFIFFSVWRILRMYTVKLYVDEDAIRYRDRFVWKKISWSEVISLGQANDVDPDEEGVLKKVKSLLIMTNNGLRRFDMTAYSLTHSMETIDKVIESRPKETVDDEDLDD